MNKIAKDHSFQQEEMGLSRVEYAYRKIKNNITTNIYPSGFQILEPELAKNLGVSRTPVREALIRLEADQLVQLIPRRGMRVNSLAVRDIREIVDVISLLMHSIINELCSPQIRYHEGQLTAFLSELAQLEETAELESWVVLEEKTFIHLAASVENHRLRAIVKCLLEQLCRVKVVVFGFEDSRSDFSKILSDIHQALKEKNNALASEKLELYCKNLLSLVERVHVRQRIQTF